MTAIDWAQLSHDEARLSQLRRVPGWPTCWDPEAKRLRCSVGQQCGPRNVFGTEYAVCPERARLDPRWQTVVQIYASMEICPRPDWPGGLVAWVEYGVHAFASAIWERDAEAAEEMRRR